MLMRGMVIYFFMQFFRRPQPNQTGAPGADGTVQLPKGAATNLFENGTLFVSYIHGWIWSVSNNLALCGITIFTPDYIYLLHLLGSLCIFIRNRRVCGIQRPWFSSLEKRRAHVWWLVLRTKRRWNIFFFNTVWAFRGKLLRIRAKCVAGELSAVIFQFFPLIHLYWNSRHCKIMDLFTCILTSLLQASLQIHQMAKECIRKSVPFTKESNWTSKNNHCELMYLLNLWDVILPLSRKSWSPIIF